MKTAIKVFIWIGIVSTFYLIFPIFVGLDALKKLEQATTKEELQTPAILTLLFCNSIAGILMLCIDENELIQAETSSVLAVEKSVEEKEILTEAQVVLPEIDKKLNKNTIALMITNLVLIFVIVICTVVPNSNYTDLYGATVGPLVVSILQFIYMLAILIIYFACKKHYNMACLILSVMLLVLTFTQIIVSFAGYDNTTDMVSYTIREQKYSYYYGYYYDWTTKYRNEYVFPAEYIVSGVAAIIVFALTLTNIILNKNQYVVKRVKKNKTTTAKPQVSKLEMELNEIKRLLDTNVIDEIEYQQMRSAILSKYVK